jgi:hypothetical protein
VDESSQSLWVMLGARAMVLRRPGADGQRSWEFYTYNTSSTEFLYPASSFVSGHNRWVVRCLMSDGIFSEIEWNSSGLALITGATRDAGRSMATPYWTSKTFTGPNRYIRHIGFFREDLTELPSATITSTRQTDTYTVATGKIFAKVTPKQSGFDHTFKINLTETMDPIDRIEIDEVTISKGRHK